MSEAAIAALRRIQTLRELTQKTGFQTTSKQFEILMALSDEDMIVVADKIALALSRLPRVRKGVSGEIRL